MRTLICEICKHEFTVNSFYNDTKCPNCKQKYIYDENIVIQLSDKQRQILREQC